MFLTIVLFYGFVAYMLYVGLRHVFMTKGLRIGYIMFACFVSYIVWEYYFQTERAQAEAPNVWVIGSLIVLFGVVVSVVPDLKKDNIAYNEKQRQLADRS